MKHIALSVVFLLVLQLVAPFAALANTSTVVYTPLGDSLAAGINENSELGNGYADFIAQSLQTEDVVVDFTKLYTCPGYKLPQVLADVENSITDTNCPYKTEPTNLTPLQERIAQSDIITISAGANDILSSISFNEQGQINVDIASALATMEQIPQQFATLLTKIRELNPDVKIIVMGFYNPMPHLTAQKGLIDGLVVQLDTVLATAVQKFGAKYTIVRDIVSSNTAQYLPNPENIHLSEAGYRAVAEQMKLQLEDAPVVELPTFNDVAETHWAAPFIQAVAAAGIMNGSNGNFQPGAPLKRIHVTSMLTRMYGYEATAAAPFTDIAGLAEATRKELDAAYSNGIARGSNNMFSPNASIQRVQLASMLLRAYEQQTGEVFVATKPLPFTDTVQLSAEEQRAVSFLFENNIVTGTSATTFAPRAATTRAAAAKIFAGILTMQ